MVIFMECSKTSVSLCTWRNLAKGIGCSKHDTECSNHRRGKTKIELPGVLEVLTQVLLTIQYPLGTEPVIGAKNKKVQFYY